MEDRTRLTRLSLLRREEDEAKANCGSESRASAGHPTGRSRKARAPPVRTHRATGRRVRARPSAMRQRCPAPASKPEPLRASHEAAGAFPGIRERGSVVAERKWLESSTCKLTQIPCN